MLVSAGLVPTSPSALESLDRAGTSGRAAARFARMVTALGGPGDLLEHPDRYLPRAPCRRVVRAARDGVVHAIDVRALGMAIVALGGGGGRAEDSIDPAVGLGTFAQLGAVVKAGDPIAQIDARDEADAARAAAAVLESHSIDEGGAEALHRRSDPRSGGIEKIA